LNPSDRSIFLIRAVEEIGGPERKGICKRDPATGPECQPKRHKTARTRIQRKLKGRQEEKKDENEPVQRRRKKEWGNSTRSKKKPRGDIRNRPITTKNIAPDKKLKGRSKGFPCRGKHNRTRSMSRKGGGGKTFTVGKSPLETKTFEVK